MRHTGSVKRRSQWILTICIIVLFTACHTRADNAYIFPNSDSSYLTLDDLQGMDKETLRLGRNEIYARRGRRFKDAALQAYFDSKSWYHGTISPEQFNDSVMLNQIERANAYLILDYENQSLKGLAISIQDRQNRRVDSISDQVLQDGITEDEFMKKMDGVWGTVGQMSGETAYGNDQYTGPRSVAYFTPDTMHVFSITHSPVETPVSAVYRYGNGFRICLAAGGCYVSDDNFTELTCYSSWNMDPSTYSGTSSMTKISETNELTQAADNGARDILALTGLDLEDAAEKIQFTTSYVLPSTGSDHPYYYYFPGSQKKTVSREMPDEETFMWGTDKYSTYWELYIRKPGYSFYGIEVGMSEVIAEILMSEIPYRCSLGLWDVFFEDGRVCEIRTCYER